MRSLLLSVLLGLALTACSKQSKTTTPPPADPAPAAAPVAAETPPQGITVGEPHPADPSAAPGPRPVSITDADMALAERLINVFNKLAANVAKAGSNCQTVATEIRTIAPELKPFTADSQKMSERLANDPAAKKWFEATYAPRITESMGTLINNPCMSDPAVGEAMQSLSF